MFNSSDVYGVELYRDDNDGEVFKRDNFIGPLFEYDLTDIWLALNNDIATIEDFIKEAKENYAYHINNCEVV